MRMSRRAGLLANKEITIKELFLPANVAHWFVIAASKSSAVSYNYDLNNISEFTSWDTVYCFFLAGGSYQISRITQSGTTYTLTELVAGYSDSSRTCSIQNDSTLTPNTTLYSGTILLVQFRNISASKITYLLSHSSPSILKYYYSSNASPSASNVRVASATVTGTDGICMAAFTDPSNVTTYFGVADRATPTTSIYSIIGSITNQTVAYTTEAVLRQYTATSTLYVVPKKTGSDTTLLSMRSYTLLGLA